jgi:uncharacterized metal-binding protein
MGCKDCRAYLCHEGPGKKLPQDCPGADLLLQQEALARSTKEPDQSLLVAAAKVEAGGYCKLTRVEETMDFARRMGYQKLGIAFCYGLRKEAALLSGVLEKNGFDVVGAICKNGGIAKSALGLSRDFQIRVDEEHETMCNPIGQALSLNQAKTELNIVVGLCVGHDSVFLRHSLAPVTVLIVKDRVLCHNPVGALYQAEGYYQDKLFKGEM